MIGNEARPNITQVGHALKPCDRLTRVFPTFRTSKMDGALTSYQSATKLVMKVSKGVKTDIPLREKGSTTFFLIPFLPFDRRLF